MLKFKELLRAPLANLWSMRHLDLVLSQLELGKNDTVLDVGCGSGFASFVLSHYAKEVVGIDISESVINVLNQRPKPANVKFIVGDATKNPPQEFLRSFDKCICLEVLEHVEVPAAILDYIQKVLKPGAKAVIIFPLGKKEHGRNRFTLEDICYLINQTNMTTNVKILEQYRLGRLASKFYRKIQDLFEPAVEADTFDKLRGFDILAKPKPIHILYKLGTILLYKLVPGSYREVVTGDRALITLVKDDVGG